MVIWEALGIAADTCHKKAEKTRNKSEKARLETLSMKYIKLRNLVEKDPEPKIQKLF